MTGKEACGQCSAKSPVHAHRDALNDDGLTANLGQDGPHHEPEPKGDGQRSALDVHNTESLGQALHKIAADHSDDHGQDDPESQEAVQEGQALD